MSRTLLILMLCLSVGSCRGPAENEAEDGEFFLAEDGEGDFEIDADADVYTGPAPLTVRFSAKAINAAGRISYTWAFNDRTTSGDQNPIHTFRKPGWYAVTLVSHDAAGATYRSHLMLHAWRPKDWARMQRRQDMRIVKRSIRELQRKNAELSAATATLASNGAVPGDVKPTR